MPKTLRNRSKLKNGSSSYFKPRRYFVGFVVVDRPDQAFDERYMTKKELKAEITKAVGDLPAGLSAPKHFHLERV